MNTLTAILKGHIWCVIIIAAILLLAAITLAFGDDVSLISHLSLASAVVSIVLAVIVIVYMYFQDHRSSQNIIEMRNIVDQASHAMTNKADLLASSAKSINQTLGMSGLTQFPADSDPTSTRLVLQEGGTLDISVYSNIGLLTLYSLGKSYELRKPISIFEILELAVDNYIHMSFFSMGIIHSLRVFLGKDYVTASAKQQELKKLPDGFKESVTAQIDKRLKNYKDKGKDEDYAELKDAWDLIDNYFDNL